VHEHNGEKKALLKVQEFTDSYINYGYTFIRKVSSTRPRFISVYDIIGAIGLWEKENEYIVIKK